MHIEVIATNIEDVKLASQSSANRIELVTGIAEGGLTPSAGLMEAAIRTASIPVYVMIRPNSQSFTYSEDDIAMMIRDIEVAKLAGAPGLVLGTATVERTVDTKVLDKLLAAADGLDITFHRAFDELADQFEALKILSAYPQISRVLTSGGQEKAEQAVNHLAQLQEIAEQVGVALQAGSGLSIHNTELLVRKTGISQLHYGGAVREMGSFQRPISIPAISELRQLLERIKNDK